MEYRNFCNFVLSLSLIYVIFSIFPSLYNAFVGASTFLAIVRLSEYLMTITRRYFLRKKISSDGKAIFITVLWAVLNNAGVSQAGEIDWTPLEEFQRVYEINAAGTLKVTKAFLPLLKKSTGRLINNTSTCGEFICPGFVGYCMSKSAAIALSVGLRIELMKWGVKVISIQPFLYKTPLTNEDTVIELTEKTWLKSDPQTREDYGENYKNNFLENTRKLLSRSSSRVGDVLDCFEDALTSEEPLSTYMPAYLPDKLGIKLLKYLPKVLEEHYLRYQLERGCKPATLMTGKKYH
ncbi:short-chain dehydrogenase/reductase family 9C member 7-like isoform X2 [Argiope bruennichi]|uniref:short-chain dehydrogenase/reductase family 9C member 7-like isoform X2 n=1 Tax=Argiope bruennichi TaxID=94029 RepID=UPI002493FDB2|nr:short-chain dehydrogenase/reductase family 9C member 7-like isoform X2 [Argiope bruennichi]